MLFGPEGRAAFTGTADDFGRAVTVVAGLAYLVGGLQALFVAIVAAATQALRWPRRATFPAVVIAGLVAGIGFVSWMVSISNTSFISIQSFALLGIHISAAIGCWLIMQGMFRLMRRVIR